MFDLLVPVVRATTDTKPEHREQADYCQGVYPIAELCLGVLLWIIIFFLITRNKLLKIRQFRTIALKINWNFPIHVYIPTYLHIYVYVVLREQFLFKYIWFFFLFRCYFVVICCMADACIRQLNDRIQRLQPPLMANCRWAQDAGGTSTPDFGLHCKVQHTYFAPKNRRRW